jgi:hypothetical protein
MPLSITGGGASIAASSNSNLVYEKTSEDQYYAYDVLFTFTDSIADYTCSSVISDSVGSNPISHGDAT